MSKSTAEILFEKHLRELRLEFVREYQFHPTRKWRWDFILMDQRIAIEIQGGIWTKGGHSTGKGIQRDYDKANHGTMRGWRVLHFSTQDVLRGRAKAFLAEHLKP